MLRARQSFTPHGWKPPAKFDEYRLLRPLGQGGMGEVYLAHDTLLDRPVAVKFISALEPDKGAREQFLTEARAAARLQHPNVLTIYRVGELDKRPFIISEFIRGTPLDKVSKPMAWTAALELGVGLSRGLAAAHRRGVLHRDIKPANAVVADDGDVKLLDFGLAKLVDAAAMKEEPESPPPSGCPYSTTLDMIEASLRSPKPVITFDAAADTLDAPRGSLAAATMNGDRRLTLVPSSRRPAGSSVRRRSSGPLRTGLTSNLRGTPGYMAPEIWRGEPATRRSDVYSLGVVLFELCTNEPLHSGAPGANVPPGLVRRDAQPLAMAAPSVDARFAAIVDRCLRRDPAERFASGDELREALEQLTSTAHKVPMPEGNPYRGLLAFEAEHRALFFGRSHEIGTLLERLRSESFVLVTGDSGVGKSSLCRAGVLPLAIEGALGEGRAWSEVSLVPGRTPLAALSSALAGLLNMEEEQLAAKSRLDPTLLARELGRCLGDTRGVILFIDQLEELATLSDPAETAIFGEALGRLAFRTPGVRLLMTVRSDFLARVAQVPCLGDELSRALYILRPLAPQNIREAIVGPAHAKGVSFESDALIETLVESTVHAEGSLPLLQFALAELWEARAPSSTVITAEALSAKGGVSGALARHADHVLLALPIEQRTAAKRILMSLVALEGTRARRTEDELVAGDTSAGAALQALVRGRLLVARDTESGVAYEVAHEALLRGWDTLRLWLDEQVDSRAVKQRLEISTLEWERLGRTREALWSARQLAELAILDRSFITPREAAFLAASERAVRRRRSMRSALIVCALCCIGLIYAATQVKARRDIDRRVATQVSEAGATLAVARADNVEVEALHRAVFKAFNSGQREEGERIWSRARALAAKVDLAYGHAGQAYETALMMDASREDVRDMLGDTLYDRALAADRDQHRTQRADLIERMALYDESGERRRRFHAPARLTVKSGTGETSVALARYIEDDDQKRRLTDARDLGVTPVMDAELEPGSYLLTLTADRRVTVRYPIVLGRGERASVAIDLPGAADVPDGFVYVPPGRFLFGSSADETLRWGFLLTVPLHEVTTGAYLIARRETTYRDWIEYLRALPPAERARRSPKVGTGGLTGAIELSERPDGEWQIKLQPTTHVYAARAGEVITYASRRRRASQDWLRLPVSGISRDDAEAYSAWLDSAGVVPRARLCTEYEWERAARGADDREYPSGSRLDPDDANFDATYNKEAASMGPDETGSHPGSRSPFGLDDMAGNVLEWTRSSLTPGEFVLRGGAYYYAALTNRSTNRVIPEPTIRDPNIGIRICASPPQR